MEKKQFDDLFIMREKLTTTQLDYEVAPKGNEMIDTDMLRRVIIARQQYIEALTSAIKTLTDELKEFALDD